MFFSRKTNVVRKGRSNRGAFHRRLILEPLEGRRLLSVTLGSPSAAAWIYGQTESVSAVVIDGVRGGYPSVGAEVDLVNAGVATAAPSPILVKGFTSDSTGDVSFDLSGLNVGGYNLMAEYTDAGGNVETSNPQPVSVGRASTATTLTSSADGQSSVPFGQPVVFKAAVTVIQTGGVSPGSAIPNGWVTFEDISTATPTVLGKARLVWGGRSRLPTPAWPPSSTRACRWECSPSSPTTRAIATSRPATTPPRPTRWLWPMRPLRRPCRPRRTRRSTIPR